MSQPRFVLPFREVTLESLARVGGKNASLGEMIRTLAPRGIGVPEGFAITAEAFRLHLRESELEDSIYAELDRLDARDVRALEAAGGSIRRRIRAALLPEAVAREAASAYGELSRRYGEAETDVAVRSSATAEDLPTASFAGQHESYLNVSGVQPLLEAVRSCMASLFTRWACRRWSAATSPARG
jgi:pyruvate,water dikinase